MPIHVVGRCRYFNLTGLIGRLILYTSSSVDLTEAHTLATIRVVGWQHGRFVAPIIENLMLLFYPLLHGCKLFWCFRLDHYLPLLPLKLCMPLLAGLPGPL